jgi:hypothetical protein
MKLSPLFVDTGLRVLHIAAALLPLLLLAHAIGFWGRGIIDKEALSFTVNYLADRSVVALVFDPALNDWGMYQARELSYLFDLIDARVFAALLDYGVLLFAPVSGTAGLLAASALYVWGSRRVLRLDRVTASLLLSLFLSCIVVQASTPIMYRSSKIVLSVALLALLFSLFSLVADREGRRRATLRQLTGLGLLGFAMALSDRQGFFFLAAATVTVAALWVSAIARGRRSGTNHLGVLITGACALGASVLYNNVAAPWIIHAVNGYWPDFTYQHLPLAELDAQALARDAWTMLRAQAGLFFGNAPFAVIGIGTVMACALRGWRMRSFDAAIVAVATAAALFLLLAVMILRHRAVFNIPDHSYWYYTLTVHVVLLFTATLWVAGADGLRRGAGKAALYAVMLLMIAGNVSQYSRQRAIMVGSARWFKHQYNRSARLVNDFEALQGRTPTGERSPASWLRMGPAGAIAEIPVGPLGFLDSAQAAYATLRRRPPLADAGGPFWRELTAFLTGAGSPLNNPDEIGNVLRGFQAIGIRRVVFDRARFQDPASGRATVEAALASAPSVRQVQDDGRIATFELMNQPSPAADVGAARRIPPQAFTVTASLGASRIPLLFDGDPDTRWLTGRNQRGDEWIRIAFAAPRDVAGVRLETAERSFGDYPRGLTITSENRGQAQVLYAGSPLGVLMKGLLREPRRAPIDIPLPPNRTVALTLRQTGQTRTWYWSIHELAIWERAR